MKYIKSQFAAKNWCYLWDGWLLIGVGCNWEEQLVCLVNVLAMDRMNSGKQQVAAARV